MFSFYFAVSNTVRSRVKTTDIVLSEIWVQINNPFFEIQNDNFRNLPTDQFGYICLQTPKKTRFSKLLDRL